METIYNGHTLVNDNYDNCKVVHIISGTLLGALSILGINRENRNINSKFVDSGKINFKFNKNNLQVFIDVGCTCSRDCCGHLCSLNYIFTKVEDIWVVIENKAFNY